MRHLRGLSSCGVVLALGLSAEAAPPRPGMPPVRGQSQAAEVGGPPCAQVAGVWIAQDWPEILTITADCKGVNNICGIEAEVDPSGIKPGTRTGRVMLHVNKVKDPSCPKAPMTVGCNFNAIDNTTVSIQCDGRPKSVFTKAE